jgi:tetratricopeptide (TPR) repeat protein
MLTLQAAAANEPADIHELRQEAERAYKDRDAEGAQLLFLQLAEDFPDDPEVWFGLSRAYEWSGELEQAIAAAERVQELGYVSAAYLSHRLAQLYALAGKPDAALQWLARALQEGYEDRPSLQSDEAFVSLQQNPEFMRLAAILPAHISDRTGGLRFDIDYLVEEAQRMHAGLDRPAFSSQFTVAAKTLHDAIPASTDAEVLAGLMRLLAILSDGHSGIYGAGPDTPLEINPTTLPLKFYVFDEGTYIVDGVGAATGLAGSRVLKFGDLSAEETLRRMSEYRGVDNPMTWNWMGPQFYLGQTLMLRQVGAITSTESVTLTLQDAAGNVRLQKIDSGDFNFRRKLRPSPAAQGTVPLYLTNVDTEYWMQSFPEQRAVYFQFNQVRNDDDQSIEEFAAELAERLDKEETKNLIIDVRHNNGGNNTLVRPLIRALVAFENAAPDNQIYVITGRNTFSAAQNFINRVERWTDATFVGEPSSSSPNFVGEETNLLLPYSRIRGSISTRFWQDSDPGDNRAWITPAVPVKPTAAAYFSNEDAAMDAIFEIITSEINH